MMRNSRGNTGARKWESKLAAKTFGKVNLFSGLATESLENSQNWKQSNNWPLWSQVLSPAFLSNFDESAGSMRGRASPVRVIRRPCARTGLIHQKKVLFRMPDICSGDHWSRDPRRIVAFPWLSAINSTNLMQNSAAVENRVTKAAWSWIAIPTSTELHSKEASRYTTARSDGLIDRVCSKNSNGHSPTPARKVSTVDMVPTLNWSLWDNIASRWINCSANRTIAIVCFDVSYRTKIVKQLWYQSTCNVLICHNHAGLKWPCISPSEAAKHETAVSPEIMLTIWQKASELSEALLTKSRQCNKILWKNHASEVSFCVQQTDEISTTGRPGELVVFPRESDTRRRTSL